MADKSKFVSKKTIISIVLVIVLLFIAGLSVGIFLADKGSTEAVDGNQSSSETQQTTEENNSEQENNDNNNVENNTTDENNTENNTNDNSDNNNASNTNTENTNETVNNGVVNNETVSNETVNNQTTENNNIKNENTNNTEITTGTNVNEIGETTVVRVEEKDKLVSRDFWDWWTPSTVVATDSAVAYQITPNTPDFTVEKKAETGIGENKLVYAGQQITYTIKVTNNGDKDLKNIEITDKIPEQTTFVSSDNAQNGVTIEEDNTVIGIKWIITIPAKESVEVKFTVKVNENATGTILNTAIVNGKESNEEKTSIINTKKTSQIIERNDVKVTDGTEIVKLGNKIKYTITVTNTGDIAGKVTIKDIVPDGTELIEDSVKEDGIISSTENNKKQVAWNVEVEANSTTERTFIVKVNDINGNIKNVATVEDVPTNPDERDTADIKVEKNVVDIKRDKESIGKEAKVKAGDVIEYLIKVTNTGSADLTNVVLDEKLDGIEVNVKDLQIGDLKAGESKEILATYTVKYEKDIQGNVEKLIHNEVVVTGETIITEPDKTPEKVTDKDEKDVPVDEVKALTINKTATKIKIKDSTEFIDAQNIKVRPGDIVEYVITVTNTGNTTLENITVTDSLKVTVDGEEKDVDSNTGVSTIAVIQSLSAVKGENTKTITTYYTVQPEDTISSESIKNVAIATVPEGPTEESHEEVPVNPDTSISVTKIWDDKNNQDGIRPEKITINLFANGEKINTVTISETEYTFEKLPTYKVDGSKIVYTISEEAVPDYIISSITGTAETGYVIKNTHSTEKTNVTVVKEWNDANNQDGIRPKSIEVKLMNDKKEIAKQTLSEENNWTYTFENLEKKENGKNINYTVEEVRVLGYTSVISGNVVNGYTITNTHTPEKTSVKVNKVWNDANNQDGIRPKKIDVILKANGEIVIGQKITLNETNQWSAEFTELDKNKKGQEIKYTVEEVSVIGYQSNISGDAEKGYTITNTHTPEKTSVKVNKVWNDADNQDGIRPKTITVRLKANGTLMENKTLMLNEENNWTAIFTDLDKKLNGQNINYTVEEDNVDGYNVEITGDAKSGYAIVNSHQVEKTSIEVNKVWEDNSNQDGVRPDNVVINLKANDVVLDNKSVTLNKDNNWTAKFDNLDKKSNGKDIVYTVVENNVPDGYETIITVDTQNKNKFIVTNKHTVDTTSITITKSWDDKNNQDGIRPSSINVKLYADGVEIKTIELNDGNQWQCQITNLPVNSNGKPIKYTVDEVGEIIGYSKKVEGYTIQNTHIPETIDIPINKEWIDNENQDGLRASEIEVLLKADGEIVDGLKLNSKNNWNGIFTNKPKKKAGKDINYTVEEISIKGYTSEVSGNTSTGFKITNTHQIEKTSVKVNKEWNDADNQDGIRPKTITVRLKANGTLMENKTLILNEENQWTGIFNDLDKKANGQDIKYTVEEDTVNEYTSTVTGNAKLGYVITNTHTPEITSVKVNKVWDDADNQDGKRPTEVTVTLKGNNEFVDTIELNNQNNWTHIFDNLPKKADGKDINYIVEEDNVKNGYKANITKKTEMPNGYEYEIKNSYVPEKLSINIIKKWEDNDNQDGIRPEDVVINLYADNQIVEGKTITLNKDNQWKGTISELPKYKNGKEIQYTFKEEKVNGYNYSITGSIEQGVVITNIHTPETIDIPVTKVWQNIDNDAARNEYLISNIILQVKNGTKIVAEKTVAEKADISKDIAGNWKYTFTGLPKYENGKLINYTVAETAVNAEEQEKLNKYYTAEINQESKVITNKFNPSNLPDQKDVVLIKIWDDSSNKYGIRPSSVEFTVDGKKYTLTAKNDENIKENSADIWTITAKLQKYDSTGKEINYKATENTVPQGYIKVSEEGTTVINRAKEIVEKKAYKADSDGNIANEVNNKSDKFKANEIVYYKLIIKNPGNVAVDTKTLTDTLPLRLRLLSVAGTNISEYPQNGTDNNSSWSVKREADSRVKLEWTVSNLTAGETRELLIKAQVIPESEYKDICKETGNESTELESVKNEVFMDNEKKDEVSIDLEEIKITGTITIKGVISSTEKVDTPMDVVFVLDTSGSMQGDNAKNMINAVNSSIKTIMSKNSDSRVGVVGFSGKYDNSITNASTIISLNKYGTNIDYLKLENNTIKSRVTNNSRKIDGGTNTQAGLKAGAEMLVNATDKQYKTTINGKEIEITRTPLLILVTDGEPTYYYNNETATGDRIGNGQDSNTNENYYYWTIRTAKYYKNQITEEYYNGTDNSSKVFTIGIGISGYEATTMLNPNESNVKACDINGYNRWGNRTQAGRLYDLLNKNGTPYAYDYADGTKTGSLTEKDIEDFLITSIEQSQVTNTVESITAEQSKNRIIELNDLDTTKEFEVTVGEVTYSSIESAKEAGYLKGDSTNGYYLDFTRVDVSTAVSITYYQKK